MLIKNPVISTIFNPLFEDKASDYVKKMIRQHSSPVFTPYLDTKVSDLPDTLKSKLNQYNPSLYEKCLENGANLTMFLRLDFLQYFDIRRGKGPEKYTIGLARVAIGELGFFETTNNMSDMALLKQLVLFAYNDGNVNKELDPNLNGLDFSGLKSMLNQRRKERNKAVQSMLSRKIIDRKSNYKVVAINSAQEAERYGKYTSWCVTHGSYDSYAKYGSRFYFCLEDGFESVKKEVGDGCPLDKYGLSMVSVLIDIDGEPTIVTTRWNHEHDGENNENLRTAEQVQDVLGIPFYQTFRPYTREELKEMGIVSFDEAKERLENGENPKDIFDDVTWFDDIACVKLNGKWNFINKEGKLLFDKWFDVIRDFNEGFACVKLNGKWNFINKEGKLLSDKWFDYVYDFKDGFACVNLNWKWNFINKEGKLLSDKWFDDSDSFNEGFACVKLNGKRNFINKEGKLLSDKWFDSFSFFKNGFALVKLNGKFNLINKEGKFLFDKWFDDIRDFN